MAGLLGAIVIGVAGMSACGPVENAVGSVLAPLRDKVNDVIDEASAQGQVLTLTAAGQVDLVLSNVESALAAQLDKSINDVDDATRRTLDDVEALVDQLASDSQTVVNQTIDGSQQLINSLPFANRNPQVRSYSPQFTAAPTDDLYVSVNGNFYWAMESEKAVTLSLNGRVYESSESTTSRVGFSIPAAVFANASDRLSRVSLELNAPYEKGKIFSSIEPGVFRLLVTVLPSKPVTELTVSTTRTVTGVESQSLTQPAEYAANGSGWRVQSWSTCDKETDTHNVSASPNGWRIVPGTVAVTYLDRGNTGRGQASILSTSPTGFVVQGQTLPNCFLGISDGSGDITYIVSYREERPTTTTKDEQVDLLAAGRPGLGWGDRVEVPVAKGQWNVHARLWDGTVIEASSTHTGNPYLTVEDQGDRVAIGLLRPGL